MCRKLSPARVLRESIAVKVELTAAPAADVRVGNAISTAILISGPVPVVNVVLAVVAAVNAIVPAEHAALVLEVVAMTMTMTMGAAVAGVPNPMLLPAPASKPTGSGDTTTATIPSANPASTAD
jgi:predicted RNA methylase